MSISGSIDQAVDRAGERGCNTFQIFTRNPRGWKFKNLKQDDVDAFIRKLGESGIHPPVAHMPYLPNIASPTDEIYSKSLHSLISELDRCQRLRIPYLVTHLGSHLGKGMEVGHERIVTAVNKALQISKGDVMLLLENTSGAKNSMGTTFQEIRKIIDHIIVRNRVGVCFDTCLPRGSLVFSNCTPRLIEELRPGDTVLGFNGAADRVVRVWERPYSGKLVYVEPEGLPGFRVTPEHPVLCLVASSWALRGSKSPESTIVKQAIWVYAKDIKLSYYLVMPRLKFREPTMINFRPYIGSATRRPLFPVIMPLTDSFAELLGLYLAEGYTFLGPSSDGVERGKVYLSFGAHEKTLIGRVTHLVEELFSLRAWTEESGSTVRVCIGSNILARFLRANFGPNAEKKRIPPFVLYAPPELVKAFLRGYLAGDGCADRSSLRYITVSNMVVCQLIHLLAKIDIRGTVRTHGSARSPIKGRPLISQGWYEVRVGREDAGKLGFSYPLRMSAPFEILRDDQCFYIPVKAVKTEPYYGEVYNITTESGAFTTPFVLTHNCHAFAGGYDLRTAEALGKTMEEFDRLIGLSRLKVVHLNDSRGELGSGLDRHEHIGLGKIGEDGFRAILRHKALGQLPLILETPIEPRRDDYGNLEKVRELAGSP